MIRVGENVHAVIVSGYKDVLKDAHDGGEWIDVEELDKYIEGVESGLLEIKKRRGTITSVSK